MRDGGPQVSRLARRCTRVAATRRGALERDTLWPGHRRNHPGVREREGGRPGLEWTTETS